MRTTQYNLIKIGANVAYSHIKLWIKFQSDWLTGNWLRIYGSFSLNFISFLLHIPQNVTDYCDIRSLFSK